MVTLPSRIYVFLSALGSLFFGIVHTWPQAGALPDQEAMFSAARGLAARANLPGYAAASGTDLINAILWQTGGPALLAWGNTLGGFVGWALLAALIFLGTSLVAGWFTSRRTRGVLTTCAALGLLVSCVTPVRTLLAGPEKLSSLSLLAPVELTDAVKTLAPEEIFATPSGEAFLLLLAPEAAGGVPPEEAARLTLDVPAWRKALRSSRWQVVLLTGPVQEYRPLLDHLIVAPDWHLAALTNHGFIFRRGPGRPVPSPNGETFRMSNDRETAIYLAQIAGRFDAIQRSAEARNSMERALELAPENPTVLVHAAHFAAAHDRWQEALTFSTKALARTPDFAQAQIVQALALLETGQPDRAQALVESVLARHPEDLHSFFLAARISRMRNDNAREAEILEHLIALSRSRGLPVLNYQIYLGQAYARLGQAEQALKNYRAVLATGQLNAEQTAEIETAIATIESRTQPGR